MEKYFHLFYLFGSESWIGYSYIPIKFRIFRIINKNRWRTEIKVLDEDVEKQYQRVGYSTKYSDKFGRYIIEE